MEKADTKNKENTQEVFKALNHELMQATFVVMVPDEIDAHGDITDAAEIRKACHNFNTFCRQPNLYHMENTNLFSIVESYTAPTDMLVDGITITKGTWLCTVQVHDEVLWQDIKSGEVNGVSIGAVASVEKLEQ